MPRNAKKVREFWGHIQIWGLGVGIFIQKSEQPSFPMFFGFWDASTTSKTNYLQLWRHQDTSKDTRKNKSFCFDIRFGNYRIWEIGNYEHVGKDACRTILEIRLTFLRILNMGSISRKQELEILYSKFNELKHDNFMFISNWRNFIISIWFACSIKGIPPTPLHSDSHPCTSPPPGGHEWSGVVSLPGHLSVNGCQRKKLTSYHVNTKIF